MDRGVGLLPYSSFKHRILLSGQPTEQPPFRRPDDSRSSSAQISAVISVGTAFVRGDPSRLLCALLPESLCR